MTVLLKWMFIETHAKWLFMILLIEYWVMVNLFPTILTVNPLANSFVEVMAFIPAVHTSDSLAIHPEETRFFIAMSFFLLLPKAIAIYIFLQKNPYSEISQYVITPCTKTKPNRSLKVGEDLTEEEAKKLLTVNRSMFSRLVWSLLSLAFAASTIFIIINVGDTSERDLLSTQRLQQSLMQGGFVMWLNFAVIRVTFCAWLIAISFFIIKDYFRFIVEIAKKIISLVFKISK